MTNKPIKLVVTGCCGRMGSLIIQEALKDSTHFQIAAAVEYPGHPQIGKPLEGHSRIIVRSDAELPALLQQGADLIIEFTTPEATLTNAQHAAHAHIPIIIGTTGFTQEQLKALTVLSKQIPIFWSPNMSIGIVIIRRAINAISQLLFKFGLGERTRPQISETHHEKKKDKPSGTAKALAEELFKATGWLIRDEEIEAKREGEVIGIHAVTFDTGTEKILLHHEAMDRSVFAQGALLVAKNFHHLYDTHTNGMYGMDDFVTAMEKIKEA